MEECLAYPTSNQGDAGSISTHGTYIFIQEGSVSGRSLPLASDYIVGFPASSSSYIYI